MDIGLGSNSPGSPLKRPPVVDSQSADFRLFLQNELLSRCRRNPNYSLRAFARSLRLDGSALSKMLKGKRAITPSTLTRVATQMGLDPEIIRKFQTALPPIGHAMRPKMDYQQLSLDAFRVVSDWYHYAVLELTKVKNFEPSPKAVAKALGLTVSEVNIAVERLVRLKMLEISEDGTWRCTGNHTTGEAELRDLAFRKLQKQVLEMAVQALDNTPLEERDQSTIAMAIDSSKVKAAAEKIAKFRREMDEFLQSGSNLDRVYHLSVALYPVSQPFKLDA